MRFHSDENGRRVMHYFDVDELFSAHLVKMARPTRQQVFERLEQAVEDLKAMGGLPTPDEARSIWEGIWEEEAHHSTAIEGNTLVRREVQLLLFDGRAVGSKELNEYLEVRGYADAALWVYAQAVRRGLVMQVEPPARVALTELREIHRRVVAPVWLHYAPAGLRRGEEPGALRLGNIEPLRPGLTPPDAAQVHALLTDWVSRANGDVGTHSERHPMMEFASLHAEFERIHPFPDGNGRVGRLALNLLLVRYGYPPAVINKRDRERYLDGLRKADQGDDGPLAEVLARAVKHGIDRFLIPGLAGPHRYVPLSSLTDMGISHNALTLAAQRGRLRAAQRNGQWYSSRQCVTDYLASRYRRQPRTRGDPNLSG